MSRTDKDVPDWYAEQYEPHHTCAEFGRNLRGYNEGECDLPDEFSYADIRDDKIRRWRNTKCGWTPHHPKGSLGYNKYNRWYRNNPTWWFHEVFRDPIRVKVRDSCRKAVQEYNGSGDTEVDIADFGRRHNGGWFW